MLPGFNTFHKNILNHFPVLLASFCIASTLLPLTDSGRLFSPKYPFLRYTHAPSLYCKFCLALNNLLCIPTTRTAQPFSCAHRENSTTTCGAEQSCSKIWRKTFTCWSSQMIHLFIKKKKKSHVSTYHGQGTMPDNEESKDKTALWLAFRLVLRYSMVSLHLQSQHLIEAALCVPAAPLQSGSLLGQGRQQRMVQSLEPCTHRGDLHEAPGSWLLIS